MHRRRFGGLEFNNSGRAAGIAFRLHGHGVDWKTLMVAFQRHIVHLPSLSGFDESVSLQL